MAACLTLIIGATGYFLARKSAQIKERVPKQLRIQIEDPWRQASAPRRWDYSPDGRRIVFVTPQGILLWEEQTGMNRQLMIRGLGDWKIGDRISVPRWSPSGRQFVFQAFRPVGGTKDSPIFVHKLFLAEANSGEAQAIGSELSDEERIRDLRWTPDGKSLTCISAKHIYSQSLDGGRSVWVDADFHGDRFSMGDYSPDGRWLPISAVTSITPNADRHLWLIPHFGGRAIPLVIRPGINHQATWSQEGSTVCFVSSGGLRNDLTWGLWKIRVQTETGNPMGAAEEALAHRGSKLIHPRFVDAGHKLIYGIDEPFTRILVANSDNLDQPAEVARGSQPVLSPDGQTIYFIGQTPEQQGIFAIDRSGKLETLRQITGLSPLGNGFPHSGLALSPDGAEIVFFAFDSNRFGIFGVPARGGTPRLLLDYAKEERSKPAWSPDGKWLACTQDKQLLRISRDGKTREILATLYRWQGWEVRWSPDGTHIAALAYENPEHWEEQPGVFAFSMANKACRRLSPESEAQYKEGLEWHPDGKRLTYFLYGPNKYDAKIRWAYLDGSPTEELLDQPEHWDYVGQWDSTGERYLFISGGAACKNSTHLLELATGKVTHGLTFDSLSLDWSGDHRTAVWSRGTEHSFFEMLEGFHK